MMSGTEGNQSIDIQNKQVAWAPKLMLPTTRGEERDKRARVLLYTAGDFSFLVFLHEEELDLQSPPGRNTVSSLLVSVRNQLDAAVLATITSQTMSPAPSIADLREPGVDFIMIDRKQQEMILYTDHNSAVQNPKPQAKSASPRKLFGFLPPPPPPMQEETRTAAISPTSLEWSVLGLDCRHLLASHLHLDVLLAFDDMMNDIATTEFLSDNDTGSKYVELCTCMTLGWVYGCANEDTELYAFFDSSTYVTVSDVQNAIKRMKEKVSQSSNAEQL